MKRKIAQSVISSTRRRVFYAALKQVKLSPVISPPSPSLHTVLGLVLTSDRVSWRRARNLQRPPSCCRYQTFLLEHFWTLNLCGRLLYRAGTPFPGRCPRPVAASSGRVTRCSATESTAPGFRRLCTAPIDIRSIKNSSTVFQWHFDKILTSVKAWSCPSWTQTPRKLKWKIRVETEPGGKWSFST